MKNYDWFSYALLKTVFSRPKSSVMIYYNRKETKDEE